jgi:solute carrier family 25 citrate transporter 1
MGFYSGVGALVAGNSLKAGVRFLSYDKFKTMLVDQDVRLLPLFLLTWD